MAAIMRKWNWMLLRTRSSTK